MKFFNKLKCYFGVYRDSFIFGWHEGKNHTWISKFCPCGKCRGYQMICICGKNIIHHCFKDY